MEQNSRAQSAKHLLNSPSAAGLGPTVNTAAALRAEEGALGPRHAVAVAPQARHSSGFAGNRVYVLLPLLPGFGAFPAESLAAAHVPFRHFNLFFSHASIYPICFQNQLQLPNQRP